MALFNRIKTWGADEVLTATDLNNEFNNLLAGFVPAKIDGLSQTTSAMQTSVSPGSTGSESPAVSVGDEVLRTRYVLQHIKGTPNWYTPALDSQTIPAEINLLTLKAQLDGVLGNLMPPGMISSYGGSTAPSNWLLCDGSAYLRTGTYANLFTAIGTSFGYGDNSTTFNVPDLRGMYLRGAIGSIQSTGSGNINTTDYNATFNGHGLRTGMRIMFTGGAIGGTNFGGNFVPAFVRVIDANTLQFYSGPTAATNIGSTANLLPYAGTNTAVIKQAQDPDNLTHFRQMPGGSASGVGSGQIDQLSNHVHGSPPLLSVSASTVPFAPASGGAGQTVTSITNNYDTIVPPPTLIGYSGSNLGVETRPTSTTVNYIIRY